MNTQPIVNPLGDEPVTEQFRPVPRPATLEGLRLGVLDNGKPNAAHVVATAGAGLRRSFGVAEVMPAGKAVASRPAPDEVLTGFRGFDAAIVGVGD